MSNGLARMVAPFISSIGWVLLRRADPPPCVGAGLDADLESGQSDSVCVRTDAACLGSGSASRRTLDAARLGRCHSRDGSQCDSLADLIGIRNVRSGSGDPGMARDAATAAIALVKRPV
jgi:hypothetical protein